MPAVLRLQLVSEFPVGLVKYSSPPAPPLGFLIPESWVGLQNVHF